MRRPAYDSPSLPIDWKRYDYVEGVNDIVYIRPQQKASVRALYKTNPEQAKRALGENPFEVRNILKNWVCSPNPEMRVIPTDTLEITVDKEAVLRSDMMIPDTAAIPDKMYISLKGRDYLTKADLMMLELLANTNWERPVYIATSVGHQNQLGLGSHFIQEGLAHRFTPFNWQKLGRVPKSETGIPEFAIDSEKMYDNLMNKFKFGGIDNPDIYLDETVMRMCYAHRRLFSQLAKQLLREGKKEKALAVLDRAQEVVPGTTVPYDAYAAGSMDMANSYVQLGHPEKAQPILTAMGDRAGEYLDWYLSGTDKQLRGNVNSCYYELNILNTVASLLDDKELSNKYKAMLDDKFTLMRMRVGR